MFPRSLPLALGHTQSVRHLLPERPPTPGGAQDCERLLCHAVGWACSLEPRRKLSPRGPLTPGRTGRLCSSPSYPQPQGHTQAVSACGGGDGVTASSEPSPWVHSPREPLSMSQVGRQGLGERGCGGTRTLGLHRLKLRDGSPEVPRPLLRCSPSGWQSSHQEADLGMSGSI